MFEFNKYEFSTKERFYVYLGLFILGISASIIVIGYVIWPAFTGKSWVIASPLLHILLTTTGGIVFWSGSKNAIRLISSAVDKSLNQYFSYRAVRFVVTKTFRLVFTVTTFLPWVFIDEPKRGRSSNNSTLCDLPDKTVDDIWQESPQHYYDDEPPPPFS